MVSCAYSYIGFQNQLTEHDTGGHGGEIAYSGCAAYGVHLEDQGDVSGNKVNMYDNGTDEQVVGSEYD